MHQGDYFDGFTVLTNEITITTSPPDRTGDGRRRLNIDINYDRLQYQYLRIEMRFYNNTEWILLDEVQFCGEYSHNGYVYCVMLFIMVSTGTRAPYHITEPSNDNDVQIVSPTATMASLICSLNITIPSNIFVSWDHNGNVATVASNRNAIQTSHSTTLLIENPQSSDAGVYQCVFINLNDGGWSLRRNIRLLITSMFLHHKMLCL